MSFSLPPAETLAIILEEPSLCNQTISFGGESIEVNACVLAAHSTYFRSLWFSEIEGKLANPLDFSHLPVDSDYFFTFLKSFFGKSFTLNKNNAYDFYFLVHYFQVDKLIVQVENHLNTHLMTWAWLKPFMKKANEINDLGALEFGGPFLSVIDDFVTVDELDDVIAFTKELSLKGSGVTSEIAETQLVSTSVTQSNLIKFSNTRKHSELQVSPDQLKVSVVGDGSRIRNIVSAEPLLPGNDYTWKLRYKGPNQSLVVGVIEESMFKIDGDCFENCQGLFNGGGEVLGYLSGNPAQWKPGELLEINVNLISNKLTIKSIRNSSIDLTGSLEK
ncbi:hypothetical protein GEMRC1_014119 [Eukaryota sp. GEM-RC1]